MLFMKFRELFSSYFPQASINEQSPVNDYWIFESWKTIWQSSISFCFIQELQGYESIRMTFVKFASENSELAGENIFSFQ